MVHAGCGQNICLYEPRKPKREKKKERLFRCYAHEDVYSDYNLELLCKSGGSPGENASLRKNQEHRFAAQWGQDCLETDGKGFA